jgi:hypothetical protein
MRRREFLPLVFAPAFASSKAEAKTNEPEWPQWRGPDRNGISKETGLLQSWPANGPKQLWSISGLGDGYGTTCISGDRIYVQGGKGKDSVVVFFKLGRL